MLCPECSEEIAENVMYCRYCGTKIEKQNINIPPKESKKQEIYYPKRETGKDYSRKTPYREDRSKNTILYLIIIFVVIGIVLIIALFASLGSFMSGWGYY